MDVLSGSHETELPIKSSKLGCDTQIVQEVIYRFLLETVKTKSPEEVLLEFQNLLINYNISATNVEAFQALSRLVYANNEQDFHYTLKRSCYILINNWETSRNHGATKELVKLFSEHSQIKKIAVSKAVVRHHLWLVNFFQSQSYYELKLFAAKYGFSNTSHWSDRYTSYLLVSQYANANNPVEQRQAARTRSQRLKDNFKFELAMYTARCQSNIANQKSLQNPTGFGEEVLRFIKMIVARRGSFSYENLANIFLEQTRHLSYKSFKHSLQNYLIGSATHKDYVELLQQKFSEKLEILYESHDQKVLDEALLLRTCNKIINYLTTEEQQQPSELFIFLMSQENPLTLVVILLKLIFVCPHARTHLETCIANLIQYYMQCPQEECQWVINFFEIFNITFAIHADNVRYNLISMDKEKENDYSKASLDTYRVFSQLRKQPHLEVDQPEMPTVGI
ncbi:hypothetical protein [Lyngbya aestuarii]|uniref:hypothetical protein n=1 Tax=Lyngbya aestuarii TaxID=118322 RepID=UPI00403D8299